MHPVNVYEQRYIPVSFCCLLFSGSRLCGRPPTCWWWPWPSLTSSWFGSRQFLSLWGCWSRSTGHGESLRAGSTASVEEFLVRPFLRSALQTHRSCHLPFPHKNRQWDVSASPTVRSKSTKQRVDPLDYFICCRQTIVFFCLGWLEQKQIRAYIKEYQLPICCLMAYFVRKLAFLSI